ncbi:MAG: hypothetical protein PHR56_07665 [Dehalococcoidales bacterium]|nr:hypothetical protein [Dehalococcoidales bacterium]
MADDFQGDFSRDVLTGIHPSYTVSATPDDEVNQLMINHFLNTLAEIALAIASRCKEGNQ